MTITERTYQTCITGCDQAGKVAQYLLSKNIWFTHEHWYHGVYAFYVKEEDKQLLIDIIENVKWDSWGIKYPTNKLWW